MSKILELRTKRNTLWEQTKDFLEKNRGENGMVKAEAVEQYNKMAQEVKDLGAEIERLEQQAQIEAQLSAPTSNPVHADPKNGAKKDVKPTATAEYAENFWNMIRNRGHYGEVRNALSVGEDTEGGFTVPDEFEKKLVAYHEVGHAMVAYKQKNAEPVQKITIVPHTQGSLGYTLLMPEEDKTELRTRDELMAKIMVSMGGRAAEEVVMNTMTNGASQDIQDATNVARNMVAMFGMSDEFGMMALSSRRNQYLDGGYGMDCAQDTAARMDQAVKDILDQCYQQAVEVIKASREDMDKVVAYLLEKETITGAEMVAIIEGRDPELVENPYASTRAEDKAFRPSSPETIEAPAKKVHMISQKIESPEEPAQEGQPENPVSDPSPSGGDAPQESGSTPSEPPKDTP